MGPIFGYIGEISPGVWVGKRDRCVGFYPTSDRQMVSVFQNPLTVRTAADGMRPTQNVLVIPLVMGVGVGEVDQDHGRNDPFGDVWDGPSSGG